MEQSKLVEKLKRLFFSEYMPFVIFCIAIYLIVFKLGLRAGDDNYFQSLLSQTSLFSFLLQRYLTWSGRMSIELFIGLVNFNMPLWRIINSIMAGLLLFGASKYATALIKSDHTRRTINIFLCCSFFLFYPYVITSGVFWYTGSFNYLWTTTACLWALLPFYYALIAKEITKNISYVFIFIMTAYACYMEQTLAIIGCLGVVVLIYLKISNQKIPHVLIAQYIFALTNIVIYALAPGTRLRAVEELHWYPDFPMLTLIDKIFQAVNWTNLHILISSNMLFLILSLLIFSVFYFKYGNNNYFLCGAFIPLLFSVLRIIPFNILLSRVANFQHGLTANPYPVDSTKNATIDLESALNNLFYLPMNANPSNLNTSYTSLFPSIICFAIILLVAVLLWFAFTDKGNRFFAVMIYFSAIVSGYILAFSPTIFASGSRVFFVSDVLTLLIIGLLLQELLTISDVLRSKYAKYAFFVFIIFAGVMYTDYIFSFASQTPWL